MKRNHHLVLGSGGIGVATARSLVARGQTVVIVSRSGRDPQITGVRPIALDAADGEAIAAAAAGASSIVNALNPPSYTRWARDWPPMAAAILTAAERSGAGLVTVSNLYGYGVVDGLMSEDQALRPNGIKGQVRAQMWTDALAAHRAGRVRATELRASDYFGAGAGNGVSYCNQYLIRPAAKGSTVRLVMGTVDAPHSWTYLADIGELAATLATDNRSWGEVWHVPTAAPRSAEALVGDVAAIVGGSTPKVRELSGFIRRTLRLIPTINALGETSHQFSRPFVLDSSKATDTFGIQPTPWDQSLAATIASLR